MKTVRKQGLVFFFLIAAMGVFCGAPGQAGASDYQNYAMISAGVNIPTGGLDDVGYNPGLTSWITYGRLLGENLVIEGSAGFFLSDENFSGSTPTAGYYEREDDIGVSALMVTLKGQFPVGPVTVFAGGGIGGYYVTLNSDIETTNLGDLDTDDDDTVWGVHVVAGVTWDLTPRIFLGGQGLYRWTDDVKLDKRVGTVPVQLTSDLDGYAVTFSGGFRF